MPVVVAADDNTATDGLQRVALFFKNLRAHCTVVAGGNLDAQFARGPGMSYQQAHRIALYRFAFLNERQPGTAHLLDVGLQRLARLHRLGLVALDNDRRPDLARLDDREWGRTTGVPYPEAQNNNQC